MWTPSNGADAIASILALVVVCLSVAILVLRSSKQADDGNVERHADRTGADAAASPMPSSNNIDLLQLRMESLHIDANALARSDPLRFGEFQRICANCASHGACALDLAHPSADAGWGEWREYCPNAAKLNELRIRAMMRSGPATP